MDAACTPTTTAADDRHPTSRRPTPVVVTTGPNHGLHLVLTLLTCGMWLPIWLLIAIVGNRQVHVAGQPTRSSPANVGAVIGGLFLLGLAITYWPVFLGLVVCGPRIPRIPGV